MKKSFTLFSLLLLLSIVSRADEVNITVTSNQFTPANVNVSVGDVIVFHFNQGYHNAVSTSVPGDAKAIDSGDPSSAVRTFSYTIAVAGTYNYECEVHAPGMAGTITASGVTPVTLKLFDISTEPDKKPLLSWRTATEQNVAYFSVRSSVDGAHFTEIAKVPAKGNSTSEQQYNYKDNTISPKFRYVFYELVTTDKDGKQYHSPIKMFKTDYAKNKLVAMLSPNPIKRPGQLMVQFNAESEGVMQVNVFDMNGKQVLKTNLSAFPGLNNGHIHVCDLPAGIYTLQFDYEGIRETKRIVVN